jgi:hypothetical protein
MTEVLTEHTTLVSSVTTFTLVSNVTPLFFIKTSRLVTSTAKGEHTPSNITKFTPVLFLATRFGFIERHF